MKITTLAGLLGLLVLGCHDSEPSPSGIIQFENDRSPSELPPGNVGDVERNRDPVPMLEPSPEADPLVSRDGMSERDEHQPQFTQAIENAFFANPNLFPIIPIRIVASDARGVSIHLDDQQVDAQWLNEQWVAHLDISGLDDAAYRIEAITHEGSVTSGWLTIRRGGLQFTDYDQVGSARTPRLHRVGQALYATWGDSSATPRGAWLQALDGSGQTIGEQIRITPEGVDCLAARVMVAGEHLAVLYQVNTRPYSNYLHVIDFDGQTILAPMALDSESRNGSHGGDITFDGSAFIAVWREANGPRDSRIRWIRIAPKTGQITGPITITTAGDDDPEGRFLPVTTLRVEAKGNQSLVTFNRGYHDPVLAVNVQRNYAVFVDSQGQIGAEEFLPTPGVFYPFGFEAHVHRLYNEFLVLWTSSDLADPGENSSLRIFGARVAPEDHQTPAHFDSTLMVNGPEARGEPFILEHPSEHALMAWTDNRSKEGDRLNGQIELTYAYASADLTLSPIQTIGHARFIEGTAQVRGVNVGTNTILSWVDERHGSGILAPKPEVYLETIWR